VFTLESFCNSVWEASYSRVSRSVSKDNYKEFTIPKKNGSRTINYLDRESELWNLQNKLFVNFFEKQTIPVCVKGFKKGESYKSFLSQHIGSVYYLRVIYHPFFRMSLK
jgi:hypothetical protein